MKWKIVLFFTLMLSISTTYAITVDGNAYLEDQTDHSGIEVFLERIAPSALTYTVYTNTSGDYSADIETGIYDVTYSKDEYFNEWLTDQSLYLNTTNGDITLLEHTTIINVPSLFTTIQSAIDRAYVNDTVLVAPGTYIENINYIGKNITVTSLFLTTQDTSYISQTIIDGNQLGSVVTFNNDEDSTAVLSGFTITNGLASDGGGIYSYHSSPSLKNLTITGNSGYHGSGLYFNSSPKTNIEDVMIINNSGNQGGGFYCLNDSRLNFTNVTIANNHSNRGGGFWCYASNPNLKNVTINNNSTNTEGGGFYCLDCSPNLENVLITGNSADEYGGGIYCDNADPSLINVTISDNQGGGIYSAGSNPSLLNSIVSDNTGDYGIYVNQFSPGNPIIIYSDFYNNENGNFFNCDEWVGVNVTTNVNGDSCDVYMNIQEDPLFVDADYNLQLSSPCIDAGDPTSPNDPDGTIADMGAYYFDQSGIIYPPEAEFTSDITEGVSPLTINFTDLSVQGSGTIDEWYWDFGNGNNSSLQNPSNEYLLPGIYTVSFTITDVNDSTDTETKTDYITVFGSDPPAPPTNVNVDIVYPDAIISWTAVDTTIYGDPCITDGYVVLFSEIQDDEYYWFLEFTSSSNYTHHSVAQFSGSMFYKVLTYVDLRREEVEYLERLHDSQCKIRWSDVKKRLGKRRSFLK